MGLPGARAECPSFPPVGGPAYTSYIAMYHTVCIIIVLT